MNARPAERHVPSTKAHARAAQMGWGLAVVSEQMAAAGLASGALAPVHAEVFVDVRLHWHPWWLLGNDGDAMPLPWRASALDRIGPALADGARTALRPAG